MRMTINGFGRIGRQAFRAALEHDDVEVVRINDIVPAESLAYLLKYDTVYGVLKNEIEAGDGEIRVDGKPYPLSNEKSPGDLPHREDGVDVALECSGIFRKRDEAQQHLDAGAKKVLISAPAQDEVDGDFILGVNDEKFDRARHRIITIGSCTTNCLAPMVKVLHDAFGVEHGLMTTVHAYTASQELVDAPERKPTRGRAAAENIVPTTTGAAEMIGKVIPEQTNVREKQLVKVMGWYDNEFAFSQRLIDMVTRMV